MEDGRLGAEHCSVAVLWSPAGAAELSTGVSSEAIAVCPQTLNRFVQPTGSPTHPELSIYALLHQGTMQ
jgi:hypothetical protein